MDATLPIPRAAFLPANIDACALYREFVPHLHIPGSLFLFRPERLNMNDIKNYEVIVVQRQVTPENFKAMQMMKAAGHKIVYDLDDNMWDLPSWNPASKMFKSMQEGFGMCAAEADVITVSTRGLMSAVRVNLPHIKRDILVTPNAVDFDLFQPSVLDKDDDRVVVGWGGSNTHSGDLLDAWDVLPSLIYRFPQLHLNFVGMQGPKSIVGHKRVESKGWVPVGEFPNRFPCWAWDISLAPLSDIRFNKSKSAVKAIEAAAVKIPCLMSDVQPYAEFAALGGSELEWLLCKTKRDWNDKLSILIEDKAKRVKLGQLMYDTAHKFFNIDTIRDNWIFALNHALGRC